MASGDVGECAGVTNSKLLPELRTYIGPIEPTCPAGASTSSSSIPTEVSEEICIVSPPEVATVSAEISRRVGAGM